MPPIIRSLVYRAVYRAASMVFANPGSYSPYIVTRGMGSPLYRYVGYRASMPQAEQAGRTIWLSLTADTQNRWTGAGVDPGYGEQGLYLSAEPVDPETPFPELQHYMDKESDPNAQVTFFRYRPQEKPLLTPARVSELRSNFLFTLKQTVTGLDLRLGKARPLLEKILDEARAIEPSIADSLEALYNHPDDASFCRGLGNAVLKATKLDFFQASSARDPKGESTNVIMRAVSRKPVEVLKPEGRNTFYLNKATGKAEGVFTIADLVYNAEFEDPTSPPKGLPSKAELNLKLKEISGQMTDSLAEEYTTSLSEMPPTPKTEEIGLRIEAVQEHLASDDIEKALVEVKSLKQDLTEQLSEARVGELQEYEVAAFQVVDSVMGALGDLTTAIDTANKEIAEGAGEPPDPDLSIEDPTVEEVDPEIQPLSNE